MVCNVVRRLGYLFFSERRLGHDEQRHDEQRHDDNRQGVGWIPQTSLITQMHQASSVDSIGNQMEKAHVWVKSSWADPNIMELDMTIFLDDPPFDPEQ